MRNKLPACRRMNEISEQLTYLLLALLHFSHTKVWGGILFSRGTFHEPLQISLFFSAAAENDEREKKFHPKRFN
jgi:hypothetical protein